jgi:hypothetical protein
VCLRDVGSTPIPQKTRASSRAGAGIGFGIFAGAVTGRLLPAMATTVVGFLAIRLVVMLAARDHYLPTETRRISVAGLTSGVDGQQWNLLRGDWIRSRRFEVAEGCPADLPDCSRS